MSGAQMNDVETSRSSSSGGACPILSSVAVVVPVKNEENNLGPCLERLSGFGQVFVLDSGSTDRTCEVARAYGATVLRFSWDGRYPKKRNWFLLNHPPAAPWVLFLDADERVTPAFRNALRDALAKGGCAGYWLRYRNWFMGRPLRFGLPQRKLALFRVGVGLYERIEEDLWSSLDMEVHEHPVIEGPIGAIDAWIDHREPQDLGRFLAKHVEYARWETSRRLALQARGGASLTARQRLKYRLIDVALFPALYFAFVYVVRLGFLDGGAGLHYAVYKAWYFHTIRLMIREKTAQRLSV